jgi:glycogen(starch) synthase
LFSAIPQGAGRLAIPDVERQTGAIPCANRRPAPAGPEQDGQPRMEPIRVSVVISTLDRAEQLKRTLESLSQLRYPAFEAVVVRGPCRDRTPEVLARFAPAIRVGECLDANLAMSRNIGVAMARGEIVAFLDDDAIPEPDWLDRLAPAFADPTVGAAGGFIRDRDGIRFQHQAIVADRLGEATSFRQLPPDLGPGRYFSPTGTNVAIRRAALLQIGGFDEEYAYFLDETDVNLRLTDAGWRLVSLPDAEVHHKFAASNLRRTDRVPRSLHLIARSKSYFCWVNAAGSHSVEAIRQELQRFQDEHGQKVERFLKRRKIDAATAERLMAEVRQGLADGERDAALPRRLPLSLGDKETGGFAPYQALAGGLRVCLVSRRFLRDTVMREAAADLIAAGHEVTVIHGGRAPSVDFRDGLWLHGVIPMPVAWATLFSPSDRFAAAAGPEMLRIQPRRQFQVVAGATADVGKLHGLGLPIVTLPAGAAAQRLIEAATLA